MHVPVLLQEVVSALNPKPGEFFIDGTLGAGGHARAIMRRLGATGKFLAVDRDKRAVDRFRQAEKPEPSPEIFLAEGSYAEIPRFLKEFNLPLADGVFLDLGFSSDQVDDSEEGGGRGFSFRYDEPLLMTYDNSEKPVKDLLKELTQEELEKIIRDYSEERYAKSIAKNIKMQEEKRSIETTKDLIEAICSAVPASYEKGRLHPATRTFMALRIYANKELEHLKRLLDSLESILANNGRAAIISFHSLEDRIVKQFFKENDEVFELITKKPIIASQEESLKNPRSRSAKLRAAMKL